MFPLNSSFLDEIASIVVIKPIHSRISQDNNVSFHVSSILKNHFPRVKSLIKVTFEENEPIFAILTPTAFSEYSCHNLGTAFDIDDKLITDIDMCILHN